MLLNRLTAFWTPTKHYSDGVLANVLSNAFQYTPANGSISIHSRILPGSGVGTTPSGGAIEENRHQPAMEITVADTGIGIDAADLPRIYDRFYRAQRARSAHSQGTGLGFSIVKSIMDLHNGSIKVTSDAGCGTTVILIFPLGPTVDTVFPKTGRFVLDGKEPAFPLIYFPADNVPRKEKLVPQGIRERLPSFMAACIFIQQRGTKRDERILYFGEKKALPVSCRAFFHKLFRCRFLRLFYPRS